MRFSVSDIIKKAEDGNQLLKDEMVELLTYPPDSLEAYITMAAARKISSDLSFAKAEIHAQFSLNLAPCPCDCRFCSFAGINGIFQSEIRLSLEEALLYSRQFEDGGANAIYVMTTAMYPFELFIEISHEIRKALRPETVMIANVGDQDLKNSIRIRDAGYTGVYHALRLREGTDTGLMPVNRKRSILNFKESGLKVGTCVEPVGPEHSNEEIADMILFTASINPAFSGAARRISIPGTTISRNGMITELRMAQIAAVTRLGMPFSVVGNCTHEPCTLGAAAGANLFWAELGANPRDIEARTEEGRGDTIEACSAMFGESGWDILKGGSAFFR